MGLAWALGTAPGSLWNVLIRLPCIGLCHPPTPGSAGERTDKQRDKVSGHWPPKQKYSQKKTDPGSSWLTSVDMRVYPADPPGFRETPVVGSLRPDLLVYHTLPSSITPDSRFSLCLELPSGRHLGQFWVFSPARCMAIATWPPFPTPKSWQSHHPQKGHQSLLRPCHSLLGCVFPWRFPKSTKQVP